MQILLFIIVFYIKICMHMYFVEEKKTVRRFDKTRREKKHKKRQQPRRREEKAACAIRCAVTDREMEKIPRKVLVWLHHLAAFCMRLSWSILSSSSFFSITSFFVYIILVSSLFSLWRGFWYSHFIFTLVHWNAFFPLPLLLPILWLYICS